MHRFAWIGWLWLACVLPVFAQGAGAVRKQAELSMLIKGEITVDHNGRVDAYTLKDPEELPPGVVAFVGNSIDTWAFEPQKLNGQPVVVRNRMRILVVARPQEEGGYQIRLQSVSFSPLSTKEGYELVSQTMAPPRYPVNAARSGVGGSVYLVLRVGRDGKVQDAVVEQVNLRAVASEGVMDRVRRMFAVASLSAGRGWTFTPPTQGDEASLDYWSVRTPIDFYMGHDEPKYGQWRAYIPGPRQSVPWVDSDLLRISPEALAEGSTDMLSKSGLRLLTPLSI